MRILLEVRHPAHVHFFKNFIKKMKSRGHIIKILAVEKECAIILLEKYNIPFIKIGKNRAGLMKKIADMIRSDAKVFKIAKKFNPDIFVGMASPSLAHVSFLMQKPFVSFCDTESAKMIWFVTKPFMNKIVTPSAYKKNLGKKHITYNGYHELAYLHPDYFKPNPDVLKELRLKKNEKFFILRFVAWTASHDVGHKGLKNDSKMKLISLLSKYGRIFITSEKPLPNELQKYNLKISPEKIHDILYYATMYIGEGATMATESAILGTPAVFISPFSGMLGNFTDLDNNYQLCYSFNDFNNAFKKIERLLKDKRLKENWQEKRRNLLKNKIDVTKWMVNFIENIND